MRTNKNRIISEFIKLVSIDSKSFFEKQMGEYLKDRLHSLEFSVYEDDAAKSINSSSGNIYGFKKGTIPGRPLLFCTHMDTVEPSAGKQAIIDQEGIIRSNGKTVLGADDCAGTTAILEALQTIHEQKIPHRSIEVLFTVAEEVYCKGAAQLDFSRIIAKEAYVLDLTGPVGTAAYKAPTIITFDAVFTGKASHAGFAPSEGIHAIAAAASAINQLTIGYTDEETTLNIGNIQGGTAGNIVPDQCIVSGEIRSYSHEKALSTVDFVTKQFAASAKKIGAKVDFAVHTHIEAYETDVHHAVVKRFKKACEAQGLPFSLVKTFGGSDNNCLAKHGINGIVVANAMNRCHSCEEYTTVEELCHIAELTVSLMTTED